ncbi:tail fiber assembly protein [Enterobacter soli]|uniref:tail fiber assembly protein n=1 Tax=Enterobacter soli TaxID=885040 RepID=UPI0037546EAB
MTDLFDKNGYATETHVVTVYSFDPITGEFLQAYNVRIMAGTGIPGATTLTPPPAVKAGFARVFSGGKWGNVEDLRGTTVYSTEDASASNVTYLGKIAAGFVVVAPSSPFDSWNGKKWVTDTAARQSFDIAQAEAQRQLLLDKADEIMRDWRDELALGAISDSDRAKLVAWLDYKKQLKALDTTQSPPLVWPDEPEA